MLLIAFNLGKYHYAMKCGSIIEIAPFVDIRPLPGVAPWIAGVIDYRGQLVPTIDLSLLTQNKESEKKFGTRILITSLDVNGEKKHIGLIAENVTNTIDYREETFEDAGVNLSDAPYLGKMFRWNGELIQLIECEQIVDDGLRQKLFGNETVN